MSVIPIPVYTTGAQGTRVAQANYDAALLSLSTKITATALLFRLTAVTTPVTLSFGIYQRSTPNGTFTLIQSASFTPGAGGAQNVSMALSGFELQPGEFLVLWGRSSVLGAATMQVYSTNSNSGLNTSVQAGEYPTTGTTVITASGGPPATIAAASITASVLNLAPILRVA